MNLFEKHLRKLEVELTAFVMVAVLIAGGAGGIFLTQAALTDTTQLSQTINAGTLATEIRDASRATVASPAVAMSAVTAGFDCLTAGNRPTGTLGTNTERVYIDNPDAADGGWVLTIAGSATTAVWTDGGSNTYDFNDAGSSGCTDGADAGDAVGGQMTIDPSGETINEDYSGSDVTTGLTKGGSSAFVEGTTNSITLLTAAAGALDVWRGYLTGIAVYNTIPAEQVAASYTLTLTVTLVAS